MHSWTISCHLDRRCGFWNLLTLKGWYVLLPSAWHHKWNVPLSFYPFLPWLCSAFKHIDDKGHLCYFPAKSTSTIRPLLIDFHGIFHHSVNSEAFKFSVHRKCKFTGATFHSGTIHRNIVYFIEAKPFEQLIYDSNMFCTINSHSFLNITPI